MPSDFVDSAKMEAEAAKRWPLWLPTGDYETDAEGYDEQSASWQNAEAEMQRQAFLAGAAAYAALLDAETTEEWGVGLRGGEIREWSTEGLARADAREVSTVTDRDGKVTEFPRRLVSRRVTPWLPSEGGKKP